jgi:hypothetical protein
MTPFESRAALTTFISESTLEEFKSKLPQFSFSEIAENFVLLQIQPVLEPKKKLLLLFQFVNSPSTLEILGKHFSVPHFLSLLEFLEQHPSYQNRLSFILVGLHPTVFSQSLHLIQHKHLTFLKHESLLEPLQYHLMQFVHEGESLWDQIERKVQFYLQKLKSIIPQELSQEGLDTLINEIDSLRDQLLNYLERLSTALFIVWQTDRIDLIENLSSINETLQHQLIHVIGHPPFDNLPSTGLYLTLYQILSTIFDAALKDNDAAIEGLTRLSIWYLKDYWELGLLPSHYHLEDLNVDTKRYSEEERLTGHQSLLSFVQKQLDHLQIGTVKSLKKNYLFSKPLLKAYISRHQHLLLDYLHNS